MTVHRRLVVTAACVLISFESLTGPAAAHGAPQDPVSRAMACGAEGGRNARSAACAAALAASGRTLRNAWDNMRIANVQGQDQRFVPDGKLCSAGLPGYEGLDLARTDWPSTQLTPGASRTFTYRSTIAHEGTFELYVTKDGYDPSQPLSWADLESKPFLTATDPVLRDGVYRIEGTLPGGKSGAHVIYTIWRNTSTPDTYYSCSDVDFGRAAASPAEETPEETAEETPEATAAGADESAQDAKDKAAGATTDPATAEPSKPAATTTPGVGAAPIGTNPPPETVATSTTSQALPFIAGGTITLLAAACLTVLTTRLRRR